VTGFRWTLGAAALKKVLAAAGLALLGQTVCWLQIQLAATAAMGLRLLFQGRAKRMRAVAAGRRLLPAGQVPAAPVVAGQAELGQALAVTEPLTLAAVAAGLAALRHHSVAQAAPASSSFGIGGPRDARVLLCPH
jgi:hypothetical protein